MTNTKRVENTTRSGVFFTKFEMFGNVVKHCLAFLIISSIKTKIKAKTEKVFFGTERFSIKCHKNHRGHRLSNEQMKSRTKNMCPGQSTEKMLHGES